MKEASFTKYFKTWYLSPISSTSTSTWLQNLISDLNDILGSEVSSKLVSMLRAKYDYHEICDEDDAIFFQLLVNKIITYKDYYLELLEAYATEIDFLDGRKSTVSRSGSGSGSSESSNEGSTTSKDYLLPNKDINGGKGNLSQQNEGSSDNSGSSSSSNEYEESVTMVGDVDVVDAKRRYLNLIRNIYSEWADKLYDCFIGLYE